MPLPLVPEFAPIVSQPALLAAFHAQPLPAVTLTDPLAPLAATLALLGGSVKAQPLVPELRELPTVVAF